MLLSKKKVQRRRGFKRFDTGRIGPATKAGITRQPQEDLGIAFIMVDAANKTFGAFPVTHWTLVGRAAGDDPAARSKALEELLRAYLPPLRGYLISRFRVQRSKADDILQNFVLRKILERDLLSQADPAKGRFRSLLLTSLSRFALNTLRDEKVAGREPSRGISSEDQDPFFEVESREPEPLAEFQRQWAKQVIDQAVEAMKQECEKKRRPDFWLVFESRTLRPALDGVDPVSYDAIVKQLSLASPGEASNLLTGAHRMFDRNVRAVVSRYQLDGTIDDEIVSLFQALSGGGPSDEPLGKELV